jgi:hypothetical protein
MDDRIHFDINESLKYYLSDPGTIPTPEADSKLFDCESDPELLSAVLVDRILDPIVDSVAENPEGLARSSFFDSLQFLLKCAPTSLNPRQSHLQESDSDGSNYVDSPHRSLQRPSARFWILLFQDLPSRPTPFIMISSQTKQRWCRTINYFWKCTAS